MKNEKKRSDSGRSSQMVRPANAKKRWLSISLSCIYQKRYRSMFLNLNEYEHFYQFYGIREMFKWSTYEEPAGHVRRRSVVRMMCKKIADNHRCIMAVIIQGFQCNGHIFAMKHFIHMFIFVYIHWYVNNANETIPIFFICWQGVS